MRNDPLFSAIESYASAHAGPEPDSYLHWLRDENGNSDDYCGTCIFAVPALPGLVACSLLWLLDIDISSPREHELDEHRNCARPCDRWRKVCISIAGEIVENAKAQRDGGYDRGESDGPRFCEYCSVQLSVCLTGYGAESELDHFEGYGPPSDPSDWYMFTEMLNSIENKELPRLFAVWEKWGLK